MPRTSFFRLTQSEWRGSNPRNLSLPKRALYHLSYIPKMLQNHDNLKPLASGWSQHPEAFTCLYLDIKNR